LFLLSILLVSSHLLAMNLATAGPLLALWLRCRRGGDDPLSQQIGLAVVGISLAGLLVGMLLGGAAILFAPDEGLWNALLRFPASAYWYGAAELAFSALCLLGMVAVWHRGGWWKWLVGVLAMLSVTNLSYHFPPWMLVISNLASDPGWAAGELFDRAQLLPLMLREEVLALSVHVVMSSIAVAACGVLWLVARKDAETIESPGGRQIARGAAICALVVSVLQIPIGVWVLLSLPAGGRNALLGDSLLASLLFIASLLLVFRLLQRLFSVAMGEFDRKQVQHVVWLLIAVVVMMTASMRLSREAAAGDWVKVELPKGKMETPLAA